MEQPVSVQTAEENEFGAASFDNVTMRELLPHYDQYLPDKALSIRARVKEIIGSIKKAGRQDMFERESEAWGELFRSNVQDLIVKAEGAKSRTEKDHFYTEAAGLLAYGDANFEQALALINQVSDGPSKAHLITTIRHMRAEKAIDDSEPETAYLFCKEIQEPNRRAELLTSVARLLEKSGSTKRARVVWNEARQLARTIQDDSERTQLTATMAAVAAEIDSMLGFEAMKEAIEVLSRQRSTS